MEIRINLDELEKKKLSVAQYLFMWSIYFDTMIRDRENLLPDALADLISRRLIVKKAGEWYLLDTAAKMFESNNELFDEFIKLFPTRVAAPNGAVRVLSPASADTVTGKKIKKKWDTITKGSKDLKEHIMRCLEAEIRMRTNTGSLHYMRNIDTWITNGTWEDYEYLLEGKSVSGVGSVPERVGVIRL